MAKRAQNVKGTGNRQARPFVRPKSANEPTTGELKRAGLTPLEAFAQIRCLMWSTFAEGAPKVLVTDESDIEATLSILEFHAALDEGLNPQDAQERADKVTAGLMAAYRSGKAKIREAMAPRRALMLDAIRSTWENMTEEQRAQAPQVAQLIERMKQPEPERPKTEAQKMEGETRFQTRTRRIRELRENDERDRASIDQKMRELEQLRK